MRIERGQHAVDRGLDQLLVRLLLDEVGAHALEDLAEQVQLTICLAGIGAGTLLGPDGGRQKRERGRAEGDRRDAEKTLHPLTLPVPAANQG